MSYWHFLIISAAVIVSAVLLYLVLGWRKDQRAFMTMCVVAIATGYKSIDCLRSLSGSYHATGFVTRKS